MALDKSITGKGGFNYSYHVVEGIHFPSKTEVGYSVIGYKSETDRDNGERSGVSSSYRKTITSSEYDAGITPASLYTDVKATGEFSGASDV